MKVGTSKASEEKAIKESINPPCIVYIDTGEWDSEGRKIFRNTITGIEQVFNDQEE